MDETVQGEEREVTAAMARFEEEFLSATHPCLIHCLVLDEGCGARSENVPRVEGVDVSRLSVDPLLLLLHLHLHCLLTMNVII